jgi:uncharacterized protein involved in type VI secretion and phage assembly
MSFPEFTGEERGGALPGVAVGIVTDNADPDDMGRVRLSFPWRDADDESDWARVAAPMAGADMGAYFLPDVGDEVLVAFAGGDIHDPYVIGGLWNGEDPPPATNEGTNDVRTVRSRNGHAVTFTDAEDGGGVELVTNAGHTVALDDTSGGERISVTDKTEQNGVVFDSVANEVTITGGATVRVESTLLELKGDGNVTIEAGGVLTLKGSLIKLN